MPAALPDHALVVEGLTKTYAPRGRQPAKTALQGISLAVPRGSFFGLLGPNGAGKSTLINILAGLVVKSSGQARIWGHDIEKEMRQARSSIGIVPQEINFDPFFTPRELLEVQAGLYGVPKSARRSDEILAALGLSDKAHAYARTLSGGMRRRLLVAKAMVHSPPVLILDEPTAGVDITLRRQLWDYVRDLNARGTTVLLTTHYLEEAQSLCDRIAIINHGRLVAHDETSVLLRQLDRKTLLITLDRDIAALPDSLIPFGAGLSEGRQIRLVLQPSVTPVGAVLGAISAAGLGIADLVTHDADLEDIFISLTEGVQG